MRPIKCKELYPDVAAQCGVTPEDVKAVSDFFWHTVRQKLTTLQDIRVHVTNLGDFTIKHWLIDKEIKKCQDIVDKRTGPSAQKYTIGLQMQQRMELLLAAGQMHQEEAQRKEFIQHHKNQTHENKQRECTEGVEE